MVYRVYPNSLAINLVSTFLVLVVYPFLIFYFANRFDIEKINNPSIEIWYLISVRRRQSFRIKRENITLLAHSTSDYTIITKRRTQKASADIIEEAIL